MADYLVVRYNRTKTCFAQVTSGSLFAKFQQSTDSLMSLRLTTGNGTCYLTTNMVNNCSSMDSGKMEISGIYADKLGLTDNVKVYAEVVENVATCRSAAIEPLSIDDWEILELNADYVQSSLLDQVRLVWTGAVLPIWVSANICIFTRVGSVEPHPSECVKLDQLTELVISPKDRQTRSHTSDQLPSPEHAISEQLLIDDGAQQPLSTNQQSSFKPATNQHSVAEYTTNQHSVSDRHAAVDHASTNGSVERPGTLFGMVRSWLPFLQSPDDAAAGEPELPATNSSESGSKQWAAVEITPVIGRVITSHLHEQSSWWSRYPSVCVVSQQMVPQSTADVFLADLTLLLSPLEIEAEAKVAAAKYRRKNQLSSLPKTERHIGTVCVVVARCDGDTPFSAPAGHIMLDEMFCRLHKITITSKVKLSTVTSLTSAVGSIQIHPTHSLPDFMTKELILVALRSHVSTMTSVHGYPFVMLSSTVINMQITADTRADFLLLIEPSKAPKKKSASSGAGDVEEVEASPSSPHFLLADENLADVTTHCEEIITKRCSGSVVPASMCPLNTPQVKPVGCPELYQRCVSFIRSSLHCKTEGALLLTGSRGTGKTTLATSLLLQMSKQDHCYTHKLDSKLLRGKRPDAMRRLLETVIQECVWRQPSILFIDDLDALCKAPSGPEEEASPEIVYSIKISEVIKDRLEIMWRQREQVVVMATSLSRSSLHSKLTATHGLHIFHFTDTIPNLSEDTRCNLLKSMLHNLDIKVLPSTEDLLQLSDKLEGYVARDLVSLAKRALHAHTIVTGDNPTSSLTMADLNAGLHGFTPASLRGITLHSPGSSTWQDVGGLHNIKEQLVRMLEWPAKYRKLYAQCPIRLQSGVLLYGAPGTGKTLIAAVVAKEMALNFISIKGPELLNKYIGASEQGVRDTFTRAQSVRPCILFFDEFESLAPRRGHDSTGVTDRVVNQLLTQLDGVEALEGVYVLAATSRPDLIDPALLRPGRLDKSLCCGIPSPDDRLEIIQALARHMCIDAEVDLADVAARCEDCTGADLKSLLSNAQLEAVHDLMNSSSLYSGGGVMSESDDEDDPVSGIYKTTIDDEARPITPQSPCYEQVRRLYSQTSIQHTEKTSPSRQSSSRSVVEPNVVVVRETHIERALADLQPSVSEKERRRYRQIYEQFTSSKSTQSANQSDQLILSKQRVSLA